MLSVLYIVVCALTFGLFKIPDAIVTDLLYLVLLTFTFPSYLRQRKKLAAQKGFKLVELSWVVFLAYFGLRLIFDQTESHYGSFLNLRQMQPYLLFFPTVAILDSPRRVTSMIAGGLFLAVVGSVLSISQSLYGTQNLFDSPWYNIGAWPGNKEMMGPVARVNLPISNWVAIVFLLLCGATLVRRTVSYIPLMSVFLVTILLTFFRSMWLSIFLSLLVQILILRKHASLNIRRIVRISLLFSLAAFVAYWLVTFSSGDKVWDELLNRVVEGLSDIQNQTGTFGSRIHSMFIVLALWLIKPWFGHGLSLYSEGTMHYVVDVGFSYVLAILGVVGLVLILFLFTVNFIAGVTCARKGASQRNARATIAGLSLASTAVYLFIYQQWLIPFSTSIMAVTAGWAMSSLATLNMDDQEPSSNAIPASTPLQGHI